MSCMLKVTQFRGLWASLVVVVMFVAASSSTAAERLLSPAPTRVACLGDSITYGSGLPDREHTTYPLILGELLGRDHEVRNFGVGGATLLAKGNRPYIEEPAFLKLLEWNPDVVVIFLGTNDSKLRNWGVHGSEFEADYAALIERLHGLDSQPRVLLCTPVPAWTSGEGIDAARVANEVVPAVRRAASKAGLELIDLHTPFQGDAGQYPDGIHPNPHGAEAIARRVFETVVADLDLEFDLQAILAGAHQEVEKGDFHGYRQLQWERDGVVCRVVLPRVAAQGHPWIWRARFWGHEPQLDRALLERGWHVAYCEVGGLFGAPSAVTRWNDFHGFLVESGLSQTPILEGMSRGGLIAYNWARENPDKVSGIYADNPVCDARSWPGGSGKGQKQGAEWAQCLQAYGLSEASVQLTTAFPVDGLAALAKADVPLLHVIGEADSIVPVQENSDVIEARYRELGGRIEVIRKPGLGHHPHSLLNPQPLIDFCLRANGLRFNPCTRAQPSVEWRGASAGWGGGTWFGQVEQINALGQAHADLNVVFLGDSITQSWTGSADRLAHADGVRAFDRWYGKRGAASFGLSGDRTEHLLYRIANGNFDPIAPKLIVLMIGVNNINTGSDDGHSVAEGTIAVVHALLAKEPQAEILLLGCFPTKKKGSWARRQSEIIHAGIARLDALERVTYLDVRKAFLLPEGALNPDTMRSDGVHITPAGYEAWAKAIEPSVRKLLGK
ncbi:MAG: lysophospholipase L1-like esterase/pimeloyl-ACP methyl ester carboxylesterase [Planctomycetota bacterium]|jgi:lysophospholipase L1-like esterase/pimeloyl-ACP methyl ester carboxylesterase